VSLSSTLARFLGRAKAARSELTPDPSLPTVPVETWEAQFPAGTAPAERWLEQRRAAGRLYADLPDDRVRMLAARFPRQTEQVQRAAERIIRHEFDLLGSGPFVPVDPDRLAIVNGYRPIDWSLDPITGLRFPRGFRHSAWTPAMRPGLADIKLPWELGRCQHWVPLGQAFRLTGDERYAAEILRQHADFLDAHPIGMGVQYVCTMDVAIRAFNWALAFELVRTAAAFDDEARRRAYRSLFDHGVFIEANLENKYEVTSNHFLSNIVGLCGVARVFSDLPAGVRWTGRCREWLEQEMRVQVLDDGADYESSIPYHRLVLELFLAGASIARLSGSPLSAEFLGRLRQMGDFLFSVLRPDGLMPQVGDADDGRLHIFSDYGEWAPQDARHLAAPMALFCGERAWTAFAGEPGLWEAAWWGEDIDGVRCEPSSHRTARLFPQAGVAVASTDRAYLLVTNGRVGTSGFGNHKHNDLLSFEVHLDGVPLFVDPGSYVYTSNPDARNLFRGTAYHNTVQVDGGEQNDLKPEYLFRLFETSEVQHVSFEDTSDLVRYRGRHTGYSRLAESVEHERTFELQKDAARLIVSDVFRGSGTHRFIWHFHVAPGVEVTSEAGREIVLSSGGRRFCFHVPDGLGVTLEDGWYSPSYGVRLPCRTIGCSLEAPASNVRTYVFELRAMPHDL
jgi:hypothetical protein